MTEAEWMSCDNPASMLAALPAANPRQLRLFAVGCVRHMLPLIRKNRETVASFVELAERYVEGESSLAEMASAHASATYYQDSGVLAAASACCPVPLVAARSAIWGVEKATPLAWVLANPGKRQGSRGARDAVEQQRRAQVRILRCVFGTAFRAVSFLNTWRTDTVLSLARQMYESRDFGAMPILADALQDAGCDNGDILDHCRGPGPHVRGCWVVDLILGKE